MKPEILAPAGSIEAVKAAIYAGADAIYLGGNRFGARAYASNFDEDTLINVIQYAHLYGVKIYLTINTLFRNEEMQQLFDYLLPYYEAGLDAVIVQDLGVISYVHENFPDLPIHASTQMTITTEYAYMLLKDYGVTRIVPARELSMDEIKQLKIGKNIPEVEVFVQGALCYSYSGQCLMSSILGGRSGNRGRCAQTCRLPYKVFTQEGEVLEGKESYILSPKDLCGLEVIPDLIKAGVDSFKIEGRMKKPEYVAACVRSYRGLLDAWYEGNFSEELIQKYKKEMAAVFNRGGFTKGYFYQKNGHDMMSVKNPGNIGVIIGTITEIRKNQVFIHLQEKLNKGDILVLEGKNDSITLTSNVDGVPGKTVVLNAPKTHELYKNQKVHRMFLKPYMDELETYITEDRKIPLTGCVELKAGESAILKVTASIEGRDYSIVEYGEAVEIAETKPLSKKVVYDKISQTGNTKYYFENLEINISDNIFYSMKDLKELRRKAFTTLENEVVNRWKRKKCVPKEIIHYFKQENNQKRLTVMVSTMEQYEIVRNEEQIDAIYLDLQYFKKDSVLSIIEESCKKIWIALPVILRRESLKETMEVIEWFKNREKSNLGVLVRNIDELSYLKQINYQGELTIDYSLYTMNDNAAAFIRSIFPKAKITISVELNQKQIKQLAFLKDNCEIEVYGRQQLMVSAQCLQSTIAKCNKKNSHFVMIDRYQKKFFVTNICKYCYSLIYNGIPTIIFDLIHKDMKENVSQRLHFIKEDRKEVLDILSMYRDKNMSYNPKTRGHYNRGVE